jgi:hypothetical protein
MTRNVGTRLNLRFYAVRPILEIQRGSFAFMVESAHRRATRLARIADCS